MTFPLHSMVCFVHCIANIFLPIEGEKNSHKDIFFFIPESMDWKEEKNQYLPSKHFLFSKTPSRRLEDVFSVTLFVFQDVFKTYLQYVFLKRLQDVLQDVFKTFSRRLQDVFQDVFKTCLQDVLQLCLQDVFKTSSRRLGRQKNVTLTVRLHQDECLLG